MIKHTFLIHMYARMNQNEEEQWLEEGTFYLWQMRISFLTLYWWTIRKFGHIYPYYPSSAGGST